MNMLCNNLIGFYVKIKIISRYVEIVSIKV